MHFRSIKTVAIAAFCCFLAFPLSPLAQPTADEIAKITAAAPATATAAPKSARKLLVFIRTEGYKHASIPYGAKALEIMGQKTGAFEAVIRDDMAAFKMQNIEQFDAICFVSTTRLKFDDHKLRDNLMDFVKRGKGIIGIHAATDNFYNWPEAAAMMGGLFDGHPWHAGGTWGIKIDDPAHPVVAAFQGNGFSINDEIYRIKKPYSRENQRVLLSLDFDDEATNEAKGIRPGDVDLPVSWVRSFGKGRVFYTCLGHNPHLYWNPTVLQHYLDGIQFTLGDLPADTTPSLEVALVKVASYAYGQSREPLTEIDAFIRFSQDSVEALRRLENRFLKILASNATLAGKQFTCEKLRIIGSEHSVSTLAKMLDDSATVEMARFALEGIPGEAVNVVLRLALQKVQDRAKIGMIMTLGQRRNRKAVPMLSNLLNDPDLLVVAAALTALGEIGTPEAADVLIAANWRLTGGLQSRLLDAYLVCSNRLHDDGRTGKALAMYRKLYESDAPIAFRAAALNGLALADSANAGKIVIAAFRNEAAEIRSTAIRLLSEIPDLQAARTIAAQLPALPVTAQLQLLAVLAERGDSELQAAAVPMLQNKQDEVRIAALKALARLGDATTVLLLARHAITHSGPEAETARESLYRLRGENVDQAIVKNLEATDPALRIELIRATGERNIITGIQAVLQAASDQAPEARLAAIRALKAIGRPSNLPELVELLIATKQNNDRHELVLTVAAVAKKIKNRTQRARAVLDALPVAKSVATRASLLSVLGKIGDPAALPKLRKNLWARNIEIKSSAIRALSDWPDAEPQADLLGLARSADNDIHRILALRGYIRLVSADTLGSPNEIVEKLRTAMALSHNPGEKKLVLSGLAQAKSPAALDMAAEYLSDSKLQQEAEVAAVKIAEAILGRNVPQLSPVLEKITRNTTNIATRNLAEKLTREAERFEDHITDWQVCGPFLKKNEPLLDFVFPPETTDEGVDWKGMPAETNPTSYWRLELDKVIGGDNRAAYLRTTVWSEQAQKSRLELGSDDGVKVWLNGVLVHTNDATRGVSPCDDVVEVALKQGWNRLLLKVVNIGGDWGASARFRRLDGSRLAGLRVRAEE